MSSAKKFYTKALIAAIIVNLLFFILLGWAWFRSMHHTAVHPVVTPAKVMPAIKTAIVSNQSANSKQAEIKGLIDLTFNHKVSVEKTFKAPGHLQGLVLTMNGSKTSHFIAYYNADLKQLYLGSVINAKGINTTIKATQQYLSNPLKPVIYQKVKQLTAVTVGPKQFKHQLTIMIDPNAPLFKPLYDGMLEENKDFNLSVRWILVNYLKPMGPNLAGWVYSGADPAKRLAQIASTPSQQWVHKKYPPLSQKVINILRSNWDLMQDYHLVPGPVTIFKMPKHYFVLKGLVDFESLEQNLPTMDK